jgi:hypothetical protein
MSEAQHSPGPWHPEAGFGLPPEVRDPQNRLICTVAADQDNHLTPENPQALANVYLLAAAPALLAACRAALPALEAWQSPHDAPDKAVLALLRAAIFSAGL